MNEKSGELLPRSVDPQHRLRLRPGSATGPLAVVAVALLLALRATLFTSEPALSPALGVMRLSSACLLGLWGALGLVHSLRPLPARLTSWLWGDARWVLVITWSTLSASLDILAGEGPLVFAGGVTVAAALGWARMGWLAAAELSALGLVALATLASASSGRSRLEDILLEAASAAAALLVALSIRRLVLPNLRRLSSLERANEQLTELSYKDELTRIYNRRFAQETGQILLKRASRYHEELHVMLIDIDHFKKINDEHSHAVGDEVLIGVAQTIQACIRAGDSVARYGGDEFIVFLVKAEGEMAQFVANRLREAVASRKFGSEGLHVTISIGIASHQGDSDLESFVDRADKYLYVSKSAGRNRAAGY